MYKSLPLLLITSLIACSIEVDISVPSLPDISYYFNISEGVTQMTIAINFLGFCIAALFYGPLSDSFGRRKIMLIGNGIMLIGASCCVVAPNITLLILSRFIQGIGASASAVVVFAMIADVYNTKASTKIIGTMNALITVCTSISPVIGSFINESIGWRANYLIVSMISIISFILLYLYLPETRTKFITFKVTKILHNYSILLKNMRFIYSSLIPSFTYAGYMIFVASGSFLYIESYHLSNLHYAIHQGTIVSAFSIVSFFSARIIQYFGKKQSIIYSVYILSISAIIILIIALIPNAPWQIVYIMTSAMILYSVGSAILYPTVFMISMNIFHDIKGTASSAIMSIRTMLCFIMIAIASIIYNGSLASVAVIIIIAIIFACLLTIALFKLL